MFSHLDMHTGLNTIYLSPEAEHIALMFSGFVECDKPDLADLGKLYGSGAVWNVHFEGRTPYLT